jgi:hypothetical protein
MDIRGYGLRKRTEDAYTHIHIHVLSAANTIPFPEQRRTWMTGKEVAKVSVSRHDNQKTATNT